MLAANFLIPNATFVVEAAIFLALLFVIARFVVPPLRGAMEERRHDIERGLVNAKRAEELLAAAEAGYEARMAEARRDARGVIDLGRKLGDQLREEGRRQGLETRARLESGR
ncbi:MAG: hypothetical protein ACRDZ5_12070 [Acidimicrobiales bacterium]